MSHEGFPLPDMVVPVDQGAQSPTNLIRHLKNLRLKEMKLRMVKLDNDHWLQRRGKQQYVGFSPQDKWEAKQFFSALDTENCGVISLDDLFQPLLASGIVDSKAQVQHLFPKSQFGAVLEFNEFLQLLETGRNDVYQARFTYAIRTISLLHYYCTKDFYYFYVLSRPTREGIHIPKARKTATATPAPNQHQPQKTNAAGLPRRHSVLQGKGTQSPQSLFSGVEDGTKAVDGEVGAFGEEESGVFS